MRMVVVVDGSVGFVFGVVVVGVCCVLCLVVWWFRCIVCWW